VVTLSLVFGLAAVSTGCGTSIADICDERCDCEGCSDWEYDECVREGERWEEEAERVGCEAEFDAYVDCIDDTWYCDRGDFEVREDCYRELYGCRGFDYD
jgi:hypothetical protein